MEEIRLLTAKEVAQMLSVRPARVHELAREGLLPCVRLGRQVRFDLNRPGFSGGWNSWVRRPPDPVVDSMPARTRLAVCNRGVRAGGGG